MIDDPKMYTISKIPSFMNSFNFKFQKEYFSLKIEKFDQKKCAGTNMKQDNVFILKLSVYLVNYIFSKRKFLWTQFVVMKNS